MLIIRTPYGNLFYINKKGFISNDGKSFSDQWLFRGLQSVKSNYFIPYTGMNEDFLKSLELLYKNGNPRFTIADKDHGTNRVHGNSKVHGVKSIAYR